MDSSLSIQSELLLDLSDRFDGRPLLVVGGQAALANAIDGETWYAPTDVREQDAANVSLGRPESAAVAVLPAPPDRELLRRELLVAAESLQSGGTMLICGANAEGGKSAIKDAEALFGAPTWSGYQHKHRMAIFRRDSLLAPDWAHQPGIEPGTWQSFEVDTPGGRIALETQAGVFAGAKLDAGTRLLLENLPELRGRAVLDVGCGVGVIGIVAAQAGARKVTMTDANLLAVEATTRNVATLNLEAEVMASDVYDHLPAERFDYIISNPPFHRGKQVDLSVANRLIADAPNLLNPGGSIVIVANTFLAYARQMEQVFTRVETVASTPQFHVLKGTLD